MDAMRVASRVARAVGSVWRLMSLEAAAGTWALAASMAATMVATSEAIEEEAAALSASVESALMELLVVASENVSRRPRQRTGGCAD